MSPNQRFTRRRLLRASAATAVGAGAVGSATALGGSDRVDDATLRESAERVPTADIRDETVPLEGGLPEQATGIRPGSQMFIEYEDGTAGCTANFIWRDTSGGSGGDGGGGGGSNGGGPPDHAGNGDGGENGNGGENGGGGNDGQQASTDAATQDDGGGGSTDGQLYIGAAGHCFLDSGCDADKQAAGPEEEGCDVSGLTVKVCADCTFGGASGLIVARGETIELGEVVYARQTEPGQEGGSGVGHDFGLVAVPSDKEHLVDPSMPQYGGPLEVYDEALPEGTPVNQYGAGVGNGEVYPTMGSNGVSFGDAGTDDQAWFAGIRASPGDSGSPLQSTTDGEPVQGDKTGGILTHLTTLGTAGTTIGRSKEMIENDIGKVIDVVLPD